MSKAPLYKVVRPLHVVCSRGCSGGRFLVKVWLREKCQERGIRSASRRDELTTAQWGKDIF
jgi:hypothetical protein